MLLLAGVTMLSSVQRATGCTAIVAGHAATADGAGYTSATGDCLDCDFRIARVPARARGELPAQRPVFLVKANYPHVVQRGRADTWEPANLDGEPEQLAAWNNGGVGSIPIGYIPEAETTYALLESGAGYGLINEKMLAMGESTCLAKFVAAPRSRGGHALFDIGELSRLAMERTATAREAVQLMGAMAEKYGYYGAEWDTQYKFEEAGESLMVSDPKEAFVFHILPDDTGKSAIWAAQRVPDDHITAVANQFIIRKIVSSDSHNFLHSDNMYAIAERHGFYDRARDGVHLDFTKTFSSVRPHSSYSTHRVYRVFTLANPDLIGVLDPYPNALMDGYPFSVKPKKKLTISDIFRMERDHYEGSPWDMTRTVAAQPFGDPDRYDVGPAGNLSKKQVAVGEFGRAISIGRTSYTAIGRSTARLPDIVGAMAYISQQAPDSSVFIPVYVAAEKLPRELTVGSLFKFHKESLFWSVLAVSNWVHRYYDRAIGDLRVVQSALEIEFSVEAPDAAATKLIGRGRDDAARKLLSEFTVTAARKVHKSYQELFPLLMARFHDGFTRKLCILRSAIIATVVSLRSIMLLTWSFLVIGAGVPTCVISARSKG
jgi:dipeptidase